MVKQAGEQLGEVLRSSALRGPTNVRSRAFAAANASAMRSAPFSVSSTLTSRRSAVPRRRSTKPLRSRVFSALETLAREELDTSAIWRGSSGPSSHSHHITRNPGQVQPIG